MELIRGPDRGGKCAGFTLVEILIVLAILSIVAAIAISTGLHAFDSARLSSTIANMRTVSDGIQMYKLDHSVLPSGGLQPVTNLQALLAPVAGDIPTEDGWGNIIYYEDLVVAGSTTYRLYGYGKDGTPDGVVTGNWIDFFTDTVMESGAFIQTKY